MLPRLVSNNQLTLQQLTLAGLGISLQLRPDVDDELRAGRLVQVLPGWGLPAIPVWAVTAGRDETLPLKLRLALAAIRQALQPARAPVG